MILIKLNDQSESEWSLKLNFEFFKNALILTKEGSQVEYFGFIINIETILEIKTTVINIGARNLHVIFQYNPGLYPVMNSISFENLNKTKIQYAVNIL